MSAVTKKPIKSERTRAAILETARTLFLEKGYDGASIRDIAGRASIDPSLVIRYFGGKDELFARAAIFDLKLPDLNGVEPREIGATLVRHFLELWEGAGAHIGLRILLKSAAMNDFAARRVQEIFTSQVLPTLSRLSGGPTRAEQAALVSSQLLGLALCRYILKLPSMVEMPAARLVEEVGQTLQRYIEGGG